MEIDPRRPAGLPARRSRRRGGISTASAIKGSRPFSREGAGPRWTSSSSGFPGRWTSIPPNGTRCAPSSPRRAGTSSRSGSPVQPQIEATFRTLPHPHSCNPAPRAAGEVRRLQAERPEAMGTAGVVPSSKKQWLPSEMAEGHDFLAREVVTRNNQGMDALCCTGCGSAYPLNDRRWKCDCGHFLDIRFALFRPGGDPDEETHPVEVPARRFPSADDRSIVSFDEGFTPLCVPRLGRGNCSEAGTAVPHRLLQDRGASVLISKVERWE